MRRSYPLPFSMVFFHTPPLRPAPPTPQAWCASIPSTQRTTDSRNASLSLPPPSPPPPRFLPRMPPDDPGRPYDELLLRLCLRLRFYPPAVDRSCSVSWHADSCLEHYSTIGVYHTTDPETEPPDWRIALRVEHDAEGPTGGKLKHADGRGRGVSGAGVTGRNGHARAALPCRLARGIAFGYVCLGGERGEGRGGERLPPVGHAYWGVKAVGAVPGVRSSGSGLRRETGFS